MATLWPREQCPVPWCYTEANGIWSNSCLYSALQDPKQQEIEWKKWCKVHAALNRLNKLSDPNFKKPTTTDERKDFFNNQ